jgi:hypothetical protein
MEISMDDKKPNGQLKKYYGYLQSKGADVPNTYESFETTLKDETAARKFHQYAVDKGFDAPPDYNSFASTFSLPSSQQAEPVKKKDETSSVGSSATSQEPSQLEKDLANAPKSPGRLHSFQEEDVDDQHKVIDHLGLNADDLFKLNKVLGDNLKYPDQKPVRWQDVPANELSQMLTGMDLKELAKKPLASDRPDQFSFDKISENMRRANSDKEELAGAQAVVRGIEKDRLGETTAMEKAGNATGAFNTPFVDLIAGAPKVIGVVTNQMERLVDAAMGKDEKDRAEITKNPFYSMGDWIDDKALEVGITATDPKLQDSFALTALPNAFGSALSLIMTGGSGSMGAKTGGMLEQAAVSGPLKQAATNLAKTLTSRPVVAGGVVMGVSEFDQAIAAGVPEEEAFKVFLKNYAIGQTEALPLERALARINKMTGGGIVQFMKAGMAGSIEEATQEAVQTYLTNQVAQGSYDPTRDSFQDMIKSMGAGAFVGFVLPGLGMAMNKMSPEQRDATKEVLHQQFQEAKTDFDTKQQNNEQLQLRNGAFQEGANRGEETQTTTEAEQSNARLGTDGRPVPNEQPGPEGQLIPPGTTVNLEVPNANNIAPDANKLPENANKLPESVPNVPESEIKLPETVKKSKAREATGDEIKQPVSDLSVDPKRFQNRDEEFSQKSVDNIVQAVLDGKFDKGEFDPIRVWKDPKDGKTYVLAGHSRTEAFKRLQKMLEEGKIPKEAMAKMKAQGFKDFKTIPAKDVSNKTEQDAIEFAKERSNVMGTQETDLARAKLWRDKRAAGGRDAGIRESIKGNSTQEKFSYLKENGKTWDAIKAVQETGQEQNKRRVYQIGEFIGEIRKRFPQLTDSHESEMFDYLFEGSGKKITTRPEFIQRIDNVVNNVTFQEDPEKPLNLENRVTRGSNEQEAVDARDEVLRQITKLEKERASKKDIPQPGRLKEINQEIELLSRELIKLDDNIRKARQGDRQQVDMFAQDKAYRQPVSPEAAPPVVKKKRKKPTLKSTETKAHKMNSKISSDPVNFSVKDGKVEALTPEGEKILAQYNRVYQKHVDLMGKRYEGEQASATKFYEVPIGMATRKPKTTRIQVAPIYGAAVKKLKDIMLDLSTSIPNTIYYTKTPIKRRRTIGSYSPSNAAIAIKYKGDIDVTAHELGHSLDDRYGILQALNTISTTGGPSGPIITGISPHPNLPTIEKELRELAQWGSNPPKGHPDKKAYRMGEGIAEYIRAYLVNPAAAGSRYPATTAFFKQQLPADVIINVEKFGTDIRNYAGLSGHGKIMSNTQFDPEKKKTTFQAFWKPSSVNKDNFRITWVDRLANKLTNDKTYFEKSVRFLEEAQGVKLDPENDPIMLARVLLGSNEKIDNIFEKGLINSRNQRMKDTVTNGPMTFEWLLQPFDNTDQATLLAEQQEAISYMVAERTVELSKRFMREDILTGIGAGIFKDLDVARERLEEFTNMALTQEGQVKYDRIKEAIRRYREYSDRVLQYLVDKGRLAQEQYDQIKADNVQYVALNRMLEAAPGEEIIVYHSSKGNKALGSTSRLAYAIKGSSQMIKNPYQSMVETTVKSVKEADRNEVMQAFRDLFRYSRKMGQGDPVVTSQVARPATSKDKNTVQIYVDGKSEYWQLDDDVYTSVKGLFDTAQTLPIVFTALPKLLRWTVTNFPIFAIRNRIRDIQQRFIVSDTKAYKGFDIYMDKKTGKLNKDLFQLFGGGQAGYYNLNDDFYYTKLDEAIKSLVGEKRTILTIPSKMAQGYKNLLTESERATRLEEYRSAFKEGRAQGMDDYNAAIFAAYKARDLLDFSVAGEYLRVVNQIIPFSNAAVQGLKKTVNAATDDPIGFAIRLSLYAIIPAILTRLLVHQLGDDEEYANLPDYRRDLFYNIPVGPDMWISIPKPFELGVLSTGAERFVSKYFLDEEEAFKGYGRSLVRSVIPVDEAALAGGYRPMIEVITNYDFFRDKTIIPPDEVGLSLELRNTGYASRLGQAMQSALGVDARNADYLIKSSASYFGDLALRVSDIGREDSRYNFNMTMTGLLRNDPVYESKDVQWVMKFVEKNGIHWSDPFLMELKGKVHDYFNTINPKEKDAAGDDAREYARMVRTVYETDDYYKRENISPEEGF